MRQTAAETDRLLEFIPLHDQAEASIIDGLFYERPLTLDPERRLMHAILIDAIQTIRGVGSGNGVNDGRRLEIERTLRWMRSDDWSWTFSFPNVCDALGLRHTAVRRALLQNAHTGNFKKRYRERVSNGK